MNEKEKQEAYERFKQKMNNNGTPLLTDKEFAEQFMKQAATKLNPNLKQPPKEIVPKRTWNPTPEQEAKLAAYYKQVCAAEKQKALKTKYSFDTELMDLQDAKNKLWGIMKEEANERKFKLTFDDGNKYALDQLIKYLIRDKSFNGSLAKGVALVGDTGRGKTFLMECLQLFTISYDLPTAFSIVDMKHIAREANTNGVEVIESCLLRRVKSVT
jgi:DNA replication protein DnaC